MTFTVIHVTPKMVDFGRIPESSYFRQLRILLYFDTPSLIVGQMPVEDVDFEFCEYGDFRSAISSNSCFTTSLPLK